jgi:hypothetical protein
MNNTTRTSSGTLQQRLLNWIAAASLGLTGATLLVAESGHLREAFGRILPGPTHHSDPVPFGSAASRPLHEHSPSQLLEEIHNMAKRGVATNDIIDQIVVEHLSTPSLNLGLKLQVAVHRHGATGLELEARRLAELHLSTQEIVERLLMRCGA